MLTINKSQPENQGGRQPPEPPWFLRLCELEMHWGWMNFEFDRVRVRVRVDSLKLPPRFPVRTVTMKNNLTAVFLAIVLLDHEQHALLGGLSTQRVWHCAYAYVLLSRD